MEKNLLPIIISACLISCGNPNGGNNNNNYNNNTVGTTNKIVDTTNKMNTDIKDSVCNILSCNFTNEFTINLNNLITSKGIILTDSLIKNLYKIDLIVSDFKSGVYDGFVENKIENMMSPSSLLMTIASELSSNNSDINSINDIILAKINYLDKSERNYQKYVSILKIISNYKKNREKYTDTDGYNEDYFYNDDYLDFLIDNASNHIEDLEESLPKNEINIEDIRSIPNSNVFKKNMYTTKRLW